VLADEPFGALDAQTRTAMQRLLVEVWHQHPTTVVFVTHDVDEALFLGDRVAVLGRDGRLVTVVDSPAARIEGADSTTARAEILSGVAA
jgi:NitT/TauT family transport system ATP-binding protein